MSLCYVVCQRVRSVARPTDTGTQGYAYGLLFQSCLEFTVKFTNWNCDLCNHLDLALRTVKCTVST